MAKKDKRNKETKDKNKAKDIESSSEKEVDMESTALENFGEKISPKNSELTVEELLKDLEKATALQEEYLNIAQRVKADFENYKRRNEFVRKESYFEGTADMIKALLPVVDDIERALDAVKESSAEDPIYKGIEMVYKQLMDIFEKKSITVIDRLGEKFDPNLEDAMLQGSPEAGEPGTICAVLQKGYQMKDTVLRYARVQVVPE